MQAEMSTQALRVGQLERALAESQERVQRRDHELALVKRDLIAATRELRAAIQQKEHATAELTAVEGRIKTYESGKQTRKQKTRKEEKKKKRRRRRKEQGEKKKKKRRRKEEEDKRRTIVNDPQRVLIACSPLPFIHSYAISSLSLSLFFFPFFFFFLQRLSG